MWNVTSLFSDSKSIHCFLYAKNAQVTFAEKLHMKMNILKRQTLMVI